jgi:hypothetical protein
LCVATVRDIKECKRRDIKCYYGFPISSFYELNALKALGVCYFKLAAPVFFKMDKVKALGIPVRIVPNVAHDGWFPREDGVCGTWVRPEDLHLYEPYVEAVEFEDADQKKE